jgi:hypothetical protein
MFRMIYQEITCELPAAEQKNSKSQIAIAMLSKKLFSVNSAQ